MNDPSRNYQALLKENTVLKQKIKELQESESRYKMLAANIGEGILVTDLTAKQFSYANPVLCQMFEYREEEILKLTVEDLHPQECWGQVLADFDALERGVKVCARDIPCLCKNGSLFYADINKTLIVLNGVKCSFSFFSDITARKLAEDALRESKNRFQAIANYAADWENWIGEDGKPHWINPRVLDFTGYTVEECLNMPDYPVPIIDEADRERMRQLIAGAIKGSSGSNIECRIICKDGRRKWISVSWRPIYDEKGLNMGHRTSIRDISSRKLLEDNLRDTKERLEAVINTLPDLMFRVDQHGYIRSCHSLDDNLYYVQPALFLGKKFTEVLPGEAARSITAALKKAAKKGISRGTIYSLPMPEGLSWYECSIATMGKPAQSGNDLIMLVRNITDRKRAEEQIKKAYDEMEKRVQERTAELAKAIDKLKENEVQLSAESLQIQESNTALKVLLERREKDQHDLEMKLLTNVKNLVLPYVGKLKLTSLTKDQAGYVEVIKTNLNNIISPFLRNLTALYREFTPREIEIADLVREGKSAKEIALLLNCSTRSIEFHKDNIRRKLGLTRQKTNLRTYLLSLTNSSS